MNRRCSATCCLTHLLSCFTGASGNSSHDRYGREYVGEYTSSGHEMEICNNYCLSRLGGAIQQENHYPLDKYHQNLLRNAVPKDLSNGYYATLFLLSFFLGSVSAL